MSIGKEKKGRSNLAKQTKSPKQVSTKAAIQNSQGLTYPELTLNPNEVHYEWIHYSHGAACTVVQNEYQYLPMQKTVRGRNSITTKVMPTLYSVLPDKDSLLFIKELSV